MFYVLLKNSLYFMSQINSLSKMYSDKMRGLKVGYRQNFDYGDATRTNTGSNTRNVKEGYERQDSDAEYAIFQASQKFRTKNNTGFKTDRDPKFLGKRRDRFISEPRLLDPIVRGNCIDEYDSFDSLIDNKYIDYQPPVIQGFEMHEISSIHELNSFHQNLENNVNFPGIMQRSSNNHNIEEGCDHTQNINIDMTDSDLKEPLLENYERKEEEVKSQIIKHLSNKAST